MIEVYGKETGCSYCEQLKTHLDRKGVDYKYYIVGKDISREDLLAKCEVPVRTVPVVFQNGKHIVASTADVMKMF